jgi:peptidoglycan/LPS O-acetylase OafA/YrhL
VLRVDRRRSAHPRLSPREVGLAATALSLLLVASPRFENYTRLQPMRAFQLIYILMFLFGGALTGEYLLKRRWRRWLLLFAPLAAGMWLVAGETFPPPANTPKVSVDSYGIRLIP